MTDFAGDPLNPPEVIFNGRLTLINLAAYCRKLEDRIVELEDRLDGGAYMPSEIPPPVRSSGLMHYEVRERPNTKGWFDIIEVSSGTSLNTQAMRRGDAELEVGRQNAALEGFNVEAHDGPAA
jgi:hypothetical protein